MIWDCIIIGGGPAGATVASILLKYRPHTKILIYEAARFPRFHVGETLVSELNVVLEEMGVYAKVANAGFIKKFGATFVWGNDSMPWNMLFGELDRPKATQDDENICQTKYTWHVERSRYDKILLDHAESLGATIQQGLKVATLVHEEGRVTGVVDVHGNTEQARIVIDATGQSGLCGSLLERDIDVRLRNVAYWGYYRNFKLEPEYNGGPDASRAFIIAHPFGWSWMFPIREDVVSFGVVTSLAHHQANPKITPQDFLRRSIESSPELKRLLGEAVPVLDDPELSPIRRVQDFSYLSKSIYQPGLVRVGDAAGFVDPILSVGCFLGQALGRVLAYALNTILENDTQVDEARALTAYADHVRDTLNSFRELTYFFYQFNGRPDDWWDMARELVSDSVFPQASDNRQAFLQFVTGFVAHGSSWREPSVVFDESFFLDIFKRFVKPIESPEQDAFVMTPETTVQLKGEVIRVDSAVPVDGKGHLAPSLRIEVRDPGHDGEQSSMQRLHIPCSMAPLLDLMSEPRSVSELSDAMATEIGVSERHRPAVNRYTRGIISSLWRRGLVACEPAVAK